MALESAHPLSRILSRAAETLTLPRQVATAALTSALSLLRGGRDPSIDARQAAALANVDTRPWSPQLLKQLEWRRFEEVCVGLLRNGSAIAAGIERRRHAGRRRYRHPDRQRRQATELDRAAASAWDAYRIGVEGGARAARAR